LVAYKIIQQKRKEARGEAAEVRAEAREERAQAAEARAEAKEQRAGEPKFSDVAGVRKEFIASSKDFVTIRDAYNRIQVSAKDPSAAGDLALIFNYMKMLDPNSVVRESEFANAENAAGVPERIRTMWNRSLQGEKLGPDQRKDFVDRANRLFKSQMQSQEKLESEYRGLAERHKIDPRDVIVDFRSGTRRLKFDAQGNPITE